MDRPRVRIYTDYKSPYAFVANKPLFALEEKLGVELEWLPYTLRVAEFMGTLLNCGIYCRLRSPILMPHPYGIFIHRNVLIGSRVTVMHQVTIGNKHPSDPGVPVIEDNVSIGAGAKILGAVRIGHSATVGANAVVTRDVPSHCTVVGANRILGTETVVRERQTDHASVVNT